MYGIVNKSIEELIVSGYGAEKWQSVRTKAGLSQQFIISTDPYDDADTYGLVGAASEVLGVSVSDLLFAFGEYWVLHTGHDSYGHLMNAGGATLYQFLQNLPQFHDRISLIFPKLVPPEFQVTMDSERQATVLYYSTRAGLTDFVKGLLSGLCKMFHEPQAGIIVCSTKDEGNDHDTFLVKW